MKNIKETETKTRKEILLEVTYWVVSYPQRLRGMVRSNQPCFMVDSTEVIERDLRRAQTALKLLRTRPDLGFPPYYGKVCMRVIEFSEPFLILLIKLNKEYQERYKTLDAFDWKSRTELKSWYKGQLTDYLNPNR